MTKLAILSYNILGPELAVEWKIPAGLNAEKTDNWKDRKSGILANLTTAAFDLALLQEVSPATEADLRAALSIASLAYFPAPKAIAVPYGCALAYNPTTLELLEGFTLLGDPARGRAAAGGHFRHLASGLSFLALSLHLKGYNQANTDDAAREKEAAAGLAELKEYLAQLEAKASADTAYLIAGGDINEHKGPDCTAFSRHAAFTEAGFSYDPAYTPTEPRTGRQIDLITAKPLTAPVTLALQTPVWPAPEASDHLPILTHLQLRGE